MALEDLEVEREARKRYALEVPKALLLQGRYERLHEMLNPPGGDQWPQDRFERPGKLHFTVNIIRSFVDTEARLESLLPRITNEVDSDDQEARKLAEMKEKTYLRFLELSGWETWMFTANQTRAAYGKTFFKPFWNTETGAPDVYIIEQPHHLIIGWGDNNYQLIDWAIFRSTLSPLQARIQYPGAPTDAYRPAGQSEFVHDATWNADHTDPLDQMDTQLASNPMRGTGYDADRVEVWDYWYFMDDGTVCNVQFLNGHLVGEIKRHPEYPGIPYIPIEFDHELGDPEGRSMTESLYDLQMGLNRAISHLAQYVWDETDPAYQLVGENAPMTVPEGIVPDANSVLAPGPGNKLEPVQKNVNQFPLADLVRIYMETAYKITGLPEILFGGMPGSQTSGRAINLQLEAAINRIDPRRRRLYDGLRQLFFFWDQMVEHHKFTVGKVPVYKLFKGLDRWKIIAPEITPRDVVEHTTNVLNKLNAKAVSLETAMDELGVEAPIEEIARVMNERSNARLFPGDAQAVAAVMLTLMQMQQAMGAQQTPGQAMEGGNEAAAAQNQSLAAAQQATPTGFEDQNQPTLQPGMAPPPGAPAPIGGELQPMVRQTASNESQAMSQIILPGRQI